MADSYQNEPIPENREQHREDMKERKEVRSRVSAAHSFLHKWIAELKAMEAEGNDWRTAIGRPDLPRDLLDRPISIVHASATIGYSGQRIGAQLATLWMPATLSIGALLALCMFRNEAKQKDEYGIAFMTQKPGKTDRQKASAASWTGVQFDDDNHQALGRDVITKAGGPLRVVYSTASDGKSADTFPTESYTKWAKKQDSAPILSEASDDVIAEFLNDGKEGRPYRGVVVERPFGNLPRVSTIDGKYHVHFRMETQTRTRTIAPFAESIEGELLDELIERGLVQKVCEAIELDIFGVIGHDRKTKNVNAVAFLPTGKRREFFYEVCGDAYLYDAVAKARHVLAENPPRPKREHVSVAPSGKAGGLRGLLLATMIEERFPELMRGTKTTPLVLDRCPFADGHGSKRGQADGSAFVFDADPERTGYPVVKCQHDSCSEYTTKDFVNEMIRNGDMPPDIYDDQEYRIELE